MELNPYLGYLFTEAGIALLSVSRTHPQLRNSLKGLQMTIRYILQGTLSLTVLFPPLFLYKLNSNNLDFTAKSH